MKMTGVLACFNGFYPKHFYSIGVYYVFWLRVSSSVGIVVCGGGGCGQMSQDFVLSASLYVSKRGAY